MKNFKTLYLEVAKFRKGDVKFEETVTGNKDVHNLPTGGTGNIDKKAKDKSRKADKKNELPEGINGEWTKEQHARLEEDKYKEKTKKKVYGDFRTSLGKANKSNIKESEADVSGYYAQSIFDVLAEIESLTNELLDNESEIYVDWKSTQRCLEDCKDNLLRKIPQYTDNQMDAEPAEATVSTGEGNY